MLVEGNIVKTPTTEQKYLSHKAQLDYITLPETERANIILQAHLNGHFGAEAIVNAIHSDGMHWENLKRDALNAVASCPECQRFNIAKHRYHPLCSITANAPGDYWAIDLGDLNITSNN
ncbi:hypothetical protein EC973_000552, partial [Apophysomyces ossiformis]